MYTSGAFLLLASLRFWISAANGDALLLEWSDALHQELSGLVGTLALLALALLALAPHQRSLRKLKTSFSVLAFHWQQAALRSTRYLCWCAQSTDFKNGTSPPR